MNDGLVDSFAIGTFNVDLYCPGILSRYRDICSDGLFMLTFSNAFAKLFITPSVIEDKDSSNRVDATQSSVKSLVIPDAFATSSRDFDERRPDKESRILSNEVNGELDDEGGMMRVKSCFAKYDARVGVGWKRHENKACDNAWLMVMLDSCKRHDKISMALKDLRYETELSLTSRRTRDAMASFRCGRRIGEDEEEEEDDDDESADLIAVCTMHLSRCSGISAVGAC